ncbi:hypothetical protein [Eggerthella sinensis]|uniref:hypothetical protein n=1 Tax=Eggerthella sinensis TaxID=242230 RepID=UPI0022E29DCE|nr:hypothetical protein [Eggerthella sinensis]
MRTAALRPLPLALAAACALGALAGCSSGSHQVIDANESCVSCHSDEKETFEWGVPVPDGVIECGPSVAVKVKGDASSIAVCTPVFTAENGSTFVPVQQMTAALSGGEAVLELDDGLWALCVDEGDHARSQLVRVDSSNGETAVVEL